MQFPSVSPPIPPIVLREPAADAVESTTDDEPAAITNDDATEHDEPDESDGPNEPSESDDDDDAARHADASAGPGRRAGPGGRAGPFPQQQGVDRGGRRRRRRRRKRRRRARGKKKENSLSIILSNCKGYGSKETSIKEDILSLYCDKRRDIR